MERLHIALPYELAVEWRATFTFSWRFAFGLCARRGFRGRTPYAEAATEFRKILDHRGIVGQDPIGALAHLQLGRVFVLSGDLAKAKDAYETFFALWKDADPDIPVMKMPKQSTPGCSDCAVTFASDSLYC